jgi:hypothetical protein
VPYWTFRPVSSNGNAACTEPTVSCPPKDGKGDCICQSDASSVSDSCGRG